MKIKVLDIQGQAKKTIELPKFFESEIREDIVAKVLEAKKRQQPYSPSPVAGKQHAAKGKIVHKRHAWRSGYGRGQSRVPRKIFSQKGTRFNWEAAEVPQARGGMRAHPPKILHFLKELKINKKENKIAFESALSATANKKFIEKKYERIKDFKKEIPFVVESEILNLKTKPFFESLKKILGEDLFSAAVIKKSIRSGKGKLRGRKYKNNAGALIVTGEKEKIKTNNFDVAQARMLNVTDLAKGGLGRLTIYTEKSINELNEKRTK
ncbi:50S ribosomal protein L4 [Candidatus Pacearchaeota archaeon]|nr:50S ribosomal protein L4 [Candidatus Pacearchaeota archaeon]MBI2057031.1 50S ribosomal protein L4 [Candidatus Pacearchaeota archaeon]